MDNRFEAVKKQSFQPLGYQPEATPCHGDCK